MLNISKKQLRDSKVKSISEKSYTLTNGNISDDFDEKTEYGYDVNGNNIYLRSESQESNWEYDQFGNVIKHSYSGGYSNYMNVIEIKYNDNGLKVEENINEINSNRKTKLTYKYNSQGYLTEESTYLEDYGIFEEIRNYIYDNSGNKITEILSGDNIPKMKISNEFDVNGNKIKSIIYNEDGSIQATWKNKYDNKNRIIEYISERDDFSGNQRDVNNYDSNGLLLEKTQYYNSNEPSIIYKYEYKFYE